MVTQRNEPPILKELRERAERSRRRSWIFKILLLIAVVGVIGLWLYGQGELLANSRYQIISSGQEYYTDDITVKNNCIEFTSRTDKRRMTICGNYRFVQLNP